MESWMERSPAGRRDGTSSSSRLRRMGLYGRETGNPVEVGREVLRPMKKGRANCRDVAHSGLSMLWLRNKPRR